MESRISVPQTSGHETGAQADGQQLKCNTYLLIVVSTMSQGLDEY